MSIINTFFLLPQFFPVIIENVYFLSYYYDMYPKLQSFKKKLIVGIEQLHYFFNIPKIPESMGKSLE